MARKKEPKVVKKIDSKALFAAARMIAEEKEIDIEFLFAQLEEAIIKAAKKADSEAMKQLEAKKRAEFKKRKADRLQRYLRGEITEEEAYAEEDAEQAELDAEAEKDPSENDTVRCVINPEDETFKIFRRYRIVEEIEAPYEITADMVDSYRPDGDSRLYAVGDVLEREIEAPENLGRLFAMNVKGIVRQGISEEEKRRKTKEINDKDKEVVSAKVITVDVNGDAKVQIGKDFFTFLKADQLPNDKLVPDSMVKVYVYVKEKPDDRTSLYANISRREPGMVRRLLEMEVPEIADGTVEIISISREAGSRTKVAVSSNQPEVDPVGACIGPRGQRINSIIKELNGEKIDVIPFSEDPTKYIAAALSPSKVVEIVVDDPTDPQKKSCRATVPNDQLSLAIGNKGQNVRLAARLTGWKIDIKPEDDRFGLLS